jgi:hypothetical protein
MEITRKTFDRLWAAAGGARGASDVRVERRLLADSESMEDLGCDSEQYISLEELPSSTWQAEEFANWQEENEGGDLVTYLREAYDSIIDGGSHDADVSPAVAFVGIVPADGDGRLVAVVLLNGYSFTEVRYRVFGFFRSVEQAEKALRAGGFIGADVSSEDLTDAELLEAWGG